MSVRLNIGAGDTEIEGFTSVDRKNGQEAYPLAYEDDSVEEIRASHILEHFGWAEVEAVLKEWVRVLVPGGRIRLAVPDVVKCMRVADRDPLWSRYITGGQTDEDDFHKTIWTEPGLHDAMARASIGNIRPWTSDNTDAASLPISLNLEGVKVVPKEQIMKVSAIMSIPRIGWNDSWGQIMEALSPLGIPISRFSGVFWGQGMQKLLEGALKAGIDWVLTIDYDSMFTAQHVSMLMDTLGNNPEIDAIASLQPKRQCHLPLMTVGDIDDGPTGSKDTKCIEITGDPVKVTTANFGLTLIRTECLKTVAKPWFYGEPCDDGTWEYGHLDPDIWFWHQWRKAGHTIYCDPKVRIGHLEVMVHQYNERMEDGYVDVVDWRAAHGFSTSASTPIQEQSECQQQRESSSSGSGLAAEDESSAKETSEKSSPT